jgi:hypothetical protein
MRSPARNVTLPSIAVAPAGGRGATFVVRLPLTTAAERREASADVRAA